MKIENKSVNPDMRETIESEARIKLKELESTGLYVFHGSQTAGIEQLEPRQPYQTKSGEVVAHGDPSVVASFFSDIAIFRALVQYDSTDFGIGDDGTPFFKASERALEYARRSTGYIYVLPKANFSVLDDDYRNLDWRSDKQETPTQIIKVTFKDLPRNIEIIESRKT